jgi:hypothetical protein
MFAFASRLHSPTSPLVKGDTSRPLHTVDGNEGRQSPSISVPYAPSVPSMPERPLVPRSDESWSRILRDAGIPETPSRAARWRARAARTWRRLLARAHLAPRTPDPAPRRTTKEIAR